MMALAFLMCEGVIETVNDGRGAFKPGLAHKWPVGVSEDAKLYAMSIRVIIGSLCILIGFFLGYHAIDILTDWQSRNNEALGVTEFTTYFELLVGVAFGIIGLWLLFKRRTS